MNARTGWILCIGCALGLAIDARAEAVRWKDCLRQPPAWYGSDEAARIARNVLLYQRASGGWPKNVDMARDLDAAERARLDRDRRKDEATIDNGATVTQLAFLARVIGGSGRPEFRDAFDRGLDYLLAAQYANGGWPQFYPAPKGYHAHITFNDNAMIGVLELLRAVAGREPDYAFVDPLRREKSAAAVKKGIACILKCQVRVAGKKTAWCAQHDESTLAPADARAYEKASLSGVESVNIVRFLMEIDHPDAEVVDAVESAAAWFEAAKVKGFRYEKRRLVADPTAPPLWARFYEIGTDRPMFSGRDGVVKFRLQDIEQERQEGYNWYGNSAGTLLAKQYPAWRKKWLRDDIR